MTNTTSPAHPSQVMQLFEKHSQRVEDLKSRRATVQFQLNQARKEYDEAVAEATATFKTADLDALRDMLRKMEAENSAAVTEFITALDTYEKLLSRVETALRDPEALNEWLLELGREDMKASAETDSMVQQTPAPALVSVDEDI